MKLPWKGDGKQGADPEVEMEFERSAEEAPERETDRDPLDPDRQFGGESLLDRQTEVDPEAEAAEWERRYGSEESRNKVGFDGGD